MKRALIKESPGGTRPSPSPIGWERAGVSGLWSVSHRRCGNSLSPLVALAAALMLVPALGLHAAPEKERVAYLGVAVADVDDTLRVQLKLGRGVGIRVQDVMAASPAEKAGVKAHDILEKLNDQMLFNAPQLSALVRGFAPGDKVNLTLIRQGERQSLEVTLGETEIAETAKSLFSVWDVAGGGPRDLGPLFAKAFVFGDEGETTEKTSAFLGVELGPVDAALATQLGLEGDKGALVNLIVEDSPAAKAGLKPHDLITKLDGKEVKDPADLSTRIREHKKGDKITLAVIRAGKTLEVEATLAEKTAPDPAGWPKLLQEYRVAPRVRTLITKPEKGEVVVHLDADNPAGGQRVERHVIVQKTEAGNKGEARVVVSGDAKSSTTAVTAIAAGGGLLNLSSGEAKSGTTSVTHKVIVVKTSEGLTTTVTDQDGHRSVTVKDAQDKVIFDGPVNTAEERQKLPAEVRERLDKIDQNVETHLDNESKEIIRELRLAPAPSVPDVI